MRTNAEKEVEECEMGIDKVSDLDGCLYLCSSSGRAHAAVRLQKRRDYYERY